MKARAGVAALVPLALSLLLGAPVGAQDASQGFGIRLVDVPTHLADDPRASQYLVDHTRPGGVVRRTVEVSNDTGEPLSVALYAAGAELAGDEFRFAEGRRHSDVSSWTAVAPDRLDLAPGTKARAEVTIRVPSDARSGEHYGVVWAEVASREEGTVKAVHRVGVRIYLSVGGGDAPEADFRIVELVPRRTGKGVPRLEAAVENSGGRAVDVSGELRLSDGPGALRAGPFPVKAGTTVPPGQSGTVAVDLPRDLPAGPWKARLVLRSGSLERSGEGTVTFPATASAKGAEVEADRGSSGPGPLAVAGAAAIAAGVTAGIVWVLRLRARQADA